LWLSRALVSLALFLTHVPQACAQERNPSYLEKYQAQAGQGSVSPPLRTPWEFSVTTFGYMVPDDSWYPAATFTADRDWLHLEARYNYEARQTGSLWSGYNFSAGKTVVVDFTPMIGGVFGNIAGIAPGGGIALSYRWFDVSSEIEYVFDLRDGEDSFLYSWNEFNYRPTSWLRIGLAAQRTRAYQTDLDIQRGLLGGFAYKRLDFTTYLFNPGWDEPTVILALRVAF
jgi:hypothetical protein